MTVTTLSTSSGRNHSVSQTRGSIRGNPPYLDRRVISEQRSKRKRRRRSPSERFETQLKTKRRLVSLAEELNDQKLKAKLKECHSKFAFLTCGTHTLKSIPNATCEFRLCPFCARRRSRRLLNKYFPMVEAYAKTNRVTPVLVTLTLKHREQSLKRANDRLSGAFKKLTRRKFWKDHFKGGVRAFDNTIGGDGLYHAHFHVLAFRSKFVNHKKLKAEWKDITGDSHVVNIKRIDDIGKGLREVLKYATKPLDIEKGNFTAEHLRDFIDLENARLVNRFGEFYTFCSKFNEEDYAHCLSTVSEAAESDLIEGDPCPYCSQTLFHLSGYTAEEYLGFRKLIESYSVRANSPPGEH